MPACAGMTVPILTSMLSRSKMSTNGHDVTHEAAARPSAPGYRPSAGLHPLCGDDLRSRFSLADHLTGQLSECACCATHEGSCRTPGRPRGVVPPGGSAA